MFKAVKTGFGVGSTYFGTLVGPSMVSGVFANIYFAKYGVHGIWLVLITMLIVAVMTASGAELVRRYKTYHYTAVAKVMLGRVYRYIWPLFECFALFAQLISIGSVISMGSILIGDFLNFPLFAGALIMMLLSLVFSLGGAQLIRTASSIMTVLLVIGFFLLTIYCIGVKFDALAQTIVEFWLPEGASLGEGIRGAAVLGLSTSSLISLSLSSVEQKVSTPLDSVSVGIWCFLLGGVAHILSTLVLLPYMAEGFALGDIPVLNIINHFLVEQVPWLPAVYTIVMFLALLSSGAPLCFVTGTRIGDLIPQKWRTGILERERVRTLLGAVVYVVVGLFISFVGLTTLVSKAYSFLGYLALPMVCVPLVFVMQIRYAMARRQNRELTQ